MDQDPLKILLLEDSAIDAEIIKRQLKKHYPDAVFMLVMTEEVYINALETFMPTLIISDNSLPTYNATEALEVKKKKCPHVPFILVTGTVSEEFAASIIKAGADDYLLKDRLTRLPAAIDAALKHNQAEKEKEKAAELLKQSEEKYRTIMIRITDAFVAFDKDWRYMYANAKAGEILRCSPDELIGKIHWDVFPDAKKQPFFSSYILAMDSQQFAHREDYFPPFDLWFESYLYPSSDGLSVYFRDITEKKKAEELLKNSEEKYRTMMERVTDAFISADKDGNYTYINNMAEKVLGKPASELVGKNMWEIFPKSMDLPFYAAFNKAFNEQQYQYVVNHYDVLDRWIENYIYPSANGLSIYFRDITEKKKAEMALAKNEKRFRKLVENGNDAFVILPLQGKPKYVSSSVERVLGYTEEEILDMDMFDLVHPNHMPEVIETLKKVMENPGVPFTGHISRLKHKDGTWHWYEDTITNMMDDPDIQGIVDNFRDVTERINDQLALKESEEKFRDIVENISDILCTHDLEGNILSVNLAAKENLGYDTNELLSINIRDILTPRSKDKFDAYINNISKEGKVKGLMHVQTKRGEKRIWEFRNSLNIKPGKPALVRGFAHDVTDRVQAQIKLSQSEKRFRALVENNEGVISLMDEEMMTIYRTPSAIRVTGWSNGEFEKTDTRENIHPDDLKILDEAMTKAHRYPGNPIPVTFRTRHKKGHYIWLEGVITNMLHDPSVGGIISNLRDVTSRKKAEEELKEERDKFSSLAKTAPGLIYSFRQYPDGRICFPYANNAIEGIFGFRHEELVDDASFVYNYVHPDDVENVSASTRISAENMSPWKCEFRYQHPEKGELWLEGSAMPLFEPEGSIIWHGIVTDITERRKAEAAKKASDEQYRTLVEQASDGIFIADNTGKFVMVNTSGCRLSGYSVEELAERTIFDIVDPENLAADPFHFEDMRLPQGARSERRMIRKDGTFLDIEISAKFLSDSRFIAFVRDISERKKAQLDILREKSLSDSIINGLPGVFYLCSSDGKLLRWNTNLEFVSEYRNEDIREMHALDFFDEEEQVIVAEAIREVFEKGSASVQANFLLKSNEKLPYYFTGIAIEYEGEPCLMGVGVDFSERLQAQEMIRESSEQLRQLTQHLQSIREEERKRIGREIHDELGQQLTAIKMDAAWLNKKIPEDKTDIKAKLQNILTLINGSSQSMRRILSELRPSILDSNGLLEALEWQNSQFTANTGIPVDFKTTETEIRLPDQVATCVFRVCQEGLTNITRYAEATKVSLFLVMSNNTLRVVLEDNGKGFDLESIKAKKRFGLLGMKERVVSFGGDFQIASSPGAGTRISFSLKL